MTDPETRPSKRAEDEAPEDGTDAKASPARDDDEQRKSEAEGPRRSRLRRVLRRTGIGFGSLVLLFASWAAFMTWYNPDVPLAKPQVVQRVPRRTDEITVVLGGDFAPTDAAMPLIRRFGYRYPYSRTDRMIRDADVSFLNLEAPVTTSSKRFPLYKYWFYRVHPRATAAWQWLGLDVVNLANNHMVDYRQRGLLDTLRHLDAAGIAHVGAGATETAARRPVIFDVGGTRIGILAYLEDRIFWRLYLRTYAVGDRVGVAKLERSDVAQDVKRLRPLVDVLIVSVHWGDNYKPVTDAQQETGRWLAGLGVDLVAGHHSHDIQAMEVRGGTPILYSLGNYAWGTPGHSTMRLGFLARLRITPRRGDARGRIRALELYPIVTQNRIVRFRPRRIRRREIRWLDGFLKASGKRGAKLELRDRVVHVALPDK